MSNPQWLTWAHQIQSLAQAGLTYSENPFDLERYRAYQTLAAEIIAAHTELNFTQAEQLIIEEKGYLTPKVDVRGVVFQDGKILLVKELLDGGRWTLPGGWVDVGEPPSQAAEREVWEESGYEVKAQKLLALYDRDLHSDQTYLYQIYKVFFLCELTGGEATTSLETGGAAFFARDEIPELSTARVTEKQIQRFFEFLDHPDWPTDFD